MTLEPLDDAPLNPRVDSPEQRRRRLEAARTLASLSIEEVPDPDELSRQLNDKYDWSWMYDDEEQPGLR